MSTAQFSKFLKQLNSIEEKLNMLVSNMDKQNEKLYEFMTTFQIQKAEIKAKADAKVGIKKEAINTFFKNQYKMKNHGVLSEFLVEIKADGFLNTQDSKDKLSKTKAKDLETKKANIIYANITNNQKAKAKLNSIKEKYYNALIKKEPILEKEISKGSNKVESSDDSGDESDTGDKSDDESDTSESDDESDTGDKSDD